MNYQNPENIRGWKGDRPEHETHIPAYRVDAYSKPESSHRDHVAQRDFWYRKPEVVPGTVSKNQSLQVLLVHLKAALTFGE